MFLDEAGYMLSPVVRRTYAPCGKTPVQYSWDRHDRISAISAVTVSSRQRRKGLYFHLLPTNENVHAEDVVRFLRELRRLLRRPLTVIWDRGNVHDRARVVRDFLRKHPEIVTEQLPPYAPDLNPDEQVWTYTKYARLANYAPANAEALRCTLIVELTCLRQRPDLLASFVKHTGLPL